MYKYILHLNWKGKESCELFWTHTHPRKYSSMICLIPDCSMPAARIHWISAAPDGTQVTSASARKLHHFPAGLQNRAIHYSVVSKDRKARV